MRSGKSILSMILAVVMVFAMMPYIAQDANASIVGGQCGENLTWSFSDGVLTISGTGDMYSYGPNAERPWENEIDNIKTLVIEGGVTSIGDNAFFGASIANVVFESPCTVTVIGTNSFSGTELEEIDIPEGVTSLGYAVFSGCKSLKTAYIPEGVTVIYSAMFSGCTSLEEVSLPEGLTTIYEGAFQNCTSLKSITIPADVTYIGAEAFTKASFEKVTFAEGSKLQTIQSGAFSGCSGLTEITIPDGTTTLNPGAFSGCSNLTKVTVPASVTSNVQFAFYNCNNINEMSFFDGGVNYYIKDGEAKIIGHSGNLPAELTIPDRVNIGTNSWPVTEISYNAFINCTDLKKVTIPAGVTTIRDLAFCKSGIESVTFEEVSSLKTIGSGAFHKCTGLTEITLPDGLTVISDGVFNACSALTKVSIPASVTKIGADVFSGCSSLTEVIYGGTEEQWKNIGGDKADIPDGVVPDCVQDINGAAVVLSKAAFTYNGKVQKPVVKTVGGSVLKEGTDFNVTFSASPQNAGTYTMTITGMKKYVGTTKTTFKINKAANTMTAKGKKPKVKYKKLKKKAQKIKRTKAIKVSNAQGTVTYKLVSAKKGSKKIKLKKARKQFKITAKTGKIKVKKKLKKGTYKLKIKVTAAGNANYNALAKTVTVNIKIK